MFRLLHTQGSARAGELILAHSHVPTPVFMPVGTQACVKALDAQDLSEILQAKIILANTYHTYLRPGAAIMKEFGGVHNFSGFAGSFLSDSGGFQAFSLGQNVKKTQEGIWFCSHIDGSKHFFTPESVLDMQYALNSDIMMILDDLIALPADEKRLAQSIETTTRWAVRSMNYHRAQQARGLAQGNHIFGIVQGGVSERFRAQSARELVELNFDGYALGGLAVGESAQEMYETIDFTTPLLPESKPRYLMGVGTPENIIEAIDRGVDMFDCVMPSRNARNGTLFTSFGKLHIKSPQYKHDHAPLDESCSCYTCKHFSRGYLHHLFRAGEITYHRLATLHNLSYYLTLVSGARAAILSNKWSEYKRRFYAKRDQS
ncbi:tRNA guanosine(34) transglycosylase Tgt [Helicobacter sp.]|uniref:tRNA guanosine(34) transglycosylase Tgt n=1 Tax=Helicobacter sp. TaxID=218 RepID=UPI00388E07A4